MSNKTSDTGSSKRASSKVGSPNPGLKYSTIFPIETNMDGQNSPYGVRKIIMIVVHIFFPYNGFLVLSN